jgi:poly-beta-1,6-N-acetyl-D-glucosamine synthase
MNISVGVITHRDRTLPPLLESILAQKPGGCDISEVIVVSSGLCPESEDAINRIITGDKRVIIVREQGRLGKAAAVNVFLGRAKGDTCVLASGDIILEPGSIGALVAPLSDGRVGMTGARLMPLNDPSTFIGFAVHLIWKMHHHISLINPKTGEFVAFKNVIPCISSTTAVDEAWVESLISAKGYLIAYAPLAIARNRGPCNLPDYINQRKRIHIGHVNLKREKGYAVASLRYPDVLRALWQCITFKPRELAWTSLVVALEAYIRILADVDSVILGRNPYCWDIIESAKIR